MMIEIRICCKAVPIFFCIRRRIVKDRKTKEKFVHEVAEAWCEECLPHDIMGHSNIRSISEEGFRRLEEEMRM